MRRWIARAAVLYPESWQRRYGVEFHALLEEINPGFIEFVDVLRGAIIMQLTNGTSFKMAGAMAAVGAVVALVVSFGVPQRYVSSAVVRLDGQVTDQEEQILQETLSRSSLAELMTRPSLNLYPEERRRMPMEDVVQHMRTRDIQIKRVVGPAPVVDISFAYPDRGKAQAVVRDLVARLTERNAMLNRNRATIWRIFWPPSDAPPAGLTIEVLDPASFPERPASPNRLIFGAYGVGAGLVLGMLVALARRRPKWTLRLAAFAGVGLGLALAVSYLIPNVYTSTAVMRFSRPQVPERLMAAVAPIPPAERIRQLEQEVLSPSSLVGMIQRLALEDLVDRMRHDIQVRALPRASAADDLTSPFSISFSYPDRLKAQAVVRELVTQFTIKQQEFSERAVASGAEAEAEVRRVLEHRAGANLELLDPATSPEAPLAPNRWTIAAGGMALGILAGALVMRRAVGQNALATFWRKNDSLTFFI